MAKCLSDYLFSEIETDLFLHKQYNILISDYVKSLFGNINIEYSNDYQSLLRYADMLSLSANEVYQNIAQQIAILMSTIFPYEKEIDIFKRNIYKNVSNFASAKMLESNTEKTERLDVFRDIEIRVHKIGNSIPGTDKQLFDTQRIALNSIKNNQFYSFSAPTSMGKTFVITNYILYKLKEGCKENFVIVVPTRALLSEIANKMIKEFKEELGIGKHKVVTTIASVQGDDNFIAVLTPERLYYALLKDPHIHFHYVFIDEAHKISDKDKRSIMYYKILDMLKAAEDVHIYFSSPVIPNPDVYLELTDFYSQSNAHSNGQAFAFSPVIQNKIYLDFATKECKIVNNLEKTLVDVGFFPDNFKDKMSTLLTIGKNKCNLIYVSSASKAINYAMKLCDLIISEDETPEMRTELESTAKQIEQKIHSDYYLANLIRKRVAYHIGALPAEIRAKIELLIRKGIIKYCFCTSTLLEGVNVPVDNLFVFDNKKGQSKMSEIDAFNLMGRAGRVTLNEYGNVFLLIDDSNEKKYYDNVLLRPLPNQTLLPAKALKKTSKLYIVNVLLEGRTNLLSAGEKYSDRGFTEVTYEYATKCMNMLLNDICHHNDSYIVRDFRKDKVLTPQNIIDIRDKFQNIVSEDDDINISARQKESLFRAVKEKNIDYPSSFDYNSCLCFLRQLSVILQWNIYEKDTLGKGDRLKYYTVILTQWMQGKGLHEIVRCAISHYKTNGGSLVSYDPVYHLELYNDSLIHKNKVINEAMKDIEQIINYKFSMYFLRLSEAIIKIHGADYLKNDWYEYVEYGTCNNSVILLQKYGFFREEALGLLRSPYSKYVKKENKCILIKKEILNVADSEMIDSISNVMINYPEIFVD